jgi:hypothetical protein
MWLMISSGLPGGGRPINLARAIGFDCYKLDADHYGVYAQFTLKREDDILIDSFIYNRETHDYSHVTDWKDARYREIMDAMRLGVTVYSLKENPVFLN